MSLDTNLGGVFYSSEDSNFFDFLLRDFAVKRYDDVQSLLVSDHEIKTVFIHLPYPWTDSADNLIKQHSQTSLEFCIVVTELHGPNYHFFKKYDQANISYFINGQLSFPLNYSPVHSYMDWFTETKDHYSKYSFLSDYVYKSYRFDALLGRNKPHRQQVYDRLISNSAIYLRYNKNQYTIDLDNWDPGVDHLEIHKDLKHSVEQVTYDDKIIRLSQIIPKKIYDMCHYSLITETHTVDGMVFLTEKTAKPLIAKRLFVLVGNQYSLKFLRSLGFKTFNTVIDESYDSIQATDLRIKMALDQVDYLCEQNPKDIHQQIQPILEYNHWLIMNTDWQKELKTYLFSKFKAS
jgi:hypothetical protein